MSFLTRFLMQLSWRAGGLLLALLLSSLVSLAQTNLFVPHDDSNQVPQNTTKSGNVLINDDNPQNLPNSAFTVTLATPPTHGSVNLNADGSYTYTPDAGYAGADSFTYRICQPGATPTCTAATATVALSVYDANVVCTLGTGLNLITNPSFTAGNVGFSSSYTYVATPSASPSLQIEGTYAIGGNSTTYHSAFYATGRTGASDNCMIVNGAASLGIVYSQTVTVQPDTYYFLSAYGASATSSSPAQLGLVVAGKSTSVVTTLPAIPNQYVQFSDVFYSGPGPAGGFPVTFEIRDINKTAFGNDFVLDDLYFGSCSTLLRAETKTTTTVINAPVPATILPLSATIATGGSAGIQVASFTVRTLPATGILYYNGFAVTAGQVIPVASPGSLSSGGTLVYVPAPGCPVGDVTFTYIATDTKGSPSNNIATYTIPVQAYTVTPGTIGADQAFCAGAPPAPLTSTAEASGGLGTYTYQWESSLDNSNWTPVRGATGITYVPGALSTTTYYRRRATSGACATAVSNVVTIMVQPVALTPGTIGADQALCAGATPASLTETTAATASGTFTYQWESSLDNTTWTPLSGATAATYTPATLSATTYYRRRVTLGACATALSNVVTITVQPVITPGTIAADQTLCAGSTPAALTSPAGANGGTGTYTYQWESSLDNSTWTPINGATSASYAPGALSTTTYYRRRVTSGVCASAATNVVAITVQPVALTPGTIGADQALCAGATPASLTETTAATASGTFTYQWESSLDNTTWTPLSGATAATYTPATLSATTYYRRRVTLGACATALSNVLTISVLPVTAPGSLGSDQTICAGSTPAPLASTAASGGSGIYAYQWESSLDNTTWTPINGATATAYAPGKLSTTTYYRRRVTSGVCAAAVSNMVTISVQPLLTPSVQLATPSAQCAGLPFSFTPAVANVGATPTYQWLVNGTQVATTPTYTSSTLATGDQVKVIVTPAAGFCATGSATATVAISLTPVVQPTLAIAAQTALPVCVGTPITFALTSVTTAGPSPQYQWQVDGVDVPGATGTTFSSASLRDGQVVTLVLHTTICAPLVATSNKVNAGITQSVVVSAGPDVTVMEGESVLLQGETNGSNPTWTPSQSLTFAGTDLLHPQATPVVTTVYTLSAGAGACTGRSSVTVTVTPRLRIPNAFTPNGDGNDDTWQIANLSAYPLSHVTIFNRWGNKLFETADYGPGNEWNGTVKGQPAPVGTYYYLLTLTNGKHYSGSLTVLY